MKNIRFTSDGSISIYGTTTIPSDLVDGFILRVRVIVELGFVSLNDVARASGTSASIHIDPSTVFMFGNQKLHIGDLEEIVREYDRRKEELVSMGDRVWIRGSGGNWCETIVANVGFREDMAPDETLFALIDISNGNRWFNPITVSLSEAGEGIRMFRFLQESTRSYEYTLENPNA